MLPGWTSKLPNTRAGYKFKGSDDSIFILYFYLRINTTYFNLKLPFVYSDNNHTKFCKCCYDNFCPLQR